MTGTLKSKLKSNKPAIGGWAMIGHASVVEIMAASGVDWVCIDLEHTSTTYEQVENMVRAAELHQTPALCRLTSNDEDQIKRVMDIGASGIIVPMVKTSNEARAAVEAMHYPPLGHRGVSLHRGTGFGNRFKDYQDWLANEAVCIVQIEHIDAVDNLEDILSVDGVDGYFIGPYDLSASMGLTGQLDHADVVAAMTRVREVAAKMKKPGGLHIVEPDPEQLQDAIGQGFTILGYSMDVRIIDTIMRQMTGRLKS
jgi:2-dehydro-3-deoxyglucarate aldolase